MQGDNIRYRLIALLALHVIVYNTVFVCARQLIGLYVVWSLVAQLKFRSGINLKPVDGGVDCPDVHL